MLRMTSTPSNHGQRRLKGGARPLAALLIFGLLCAASAVAEPPKQLWSARLPGDAKWQQITELGTLLVGTNDALLCFNPDSGELLWRNDQIKRTTPQNVKEIAGTPVIVANDQEGLGGTKTNLLAIDYMTGKQLWKAPEMVGQFIGILPAAEKNLVLLLFNGAAENLGQGTHIYAFDLGTGERKWVTKYAKSGAITLHLADNSGAFSPRMDLSGHQDPVVVGGRMYLPFLGIHSLDLDSGKILWGVPFETANPGHKRAYPALRFADGKVYGGGGGEIYCVNQETGALVWKSQRVAAAGMKSWHDAILSQVEILGGKVFVRMGGNYSDGKQVVLKKPMGVLALDNGTGKELWRSKEIDHGITNLVPVPAQNVIMCADGDSLLGLDAAAPGYVEKFRVRIEFKRKMGAGDIAKIGLGALGGLSGIGKAAFSSNRARLDVPVALVNADGKIAVSGRQHLMLFNPATNNIEWSLYYAAPSDAFANVAMFAVTALAATYGNMQAYQGGVGSGQYRQGVENIHRSLDSYNRYTERRNLRIKSKGSEKYRYIITNIEKGGVGVIGVNLATGASDRQVVFGEKEPMYLADEEANRIFHFKGKDSVVAYQF